MTDRKPRIYSDANVIIEYARYARKLHDPVKANDLWFFGQMLRASDDGILDVFTSSISLAECTHVKDESDPKDIEVVYDQQLQEFLDRLLLSGTLIKLVQDSIFVGQKARDLLWKHDIKLKGMDGIHVASALDAECKEFLTWDTDIGKPAVAAKIKALQKMGVRVITPRDSRLLPGEYTQSHLIRDSATPQSKGLLNGQEAKSENTAANTTELRADDSGSAGNTAGAQAEEEGKD